MKTNGKTLRFISGLISLTATLLFPSSLYCQNEDKHEQYVALMDSADHAISLENWRRAEKFLIDALRLEPANPSNIILISNLGMVRFYDGRDSMALATLNDGVEMAPNSVVLLQNRAKVLSALGRHDEAYADRSRIVSLDSTNVDNLYLHAISALYQNDPDALDRDLSLMQKVAPDDNRTFFVSIQRLMAQGSYREAISPLNKLIKNRPTAEAFAMRALCNIMIDRLDEASEDIAHGLRLDPADPELYLYRALLNKFRYRNEEARKDAQRAVELGIDPRRAEPLL